MEADEAKCNPTMTQLIKESEVFADLWHHLMSHPDEANRIAKLGPVATTKEIVKLELKLATPPQVTKPKPDPLPAPIKATKTAATAAPIRLHKYTEY